MTTGAPRQPWLHDSVICVLGNVTAVSGQLGDMRSVDHDGRALADGLFVDDRRAVSELSVTVGGARPVAVTHRGLGSAAEFLASARNLGSVTPDPVVEVHRVRELTRTGMRERIRVTSRADREMVTDLVVSLSSDTAPISAVKSGLVSAVPLVPEPAEGGAVFRGEWHDCTVLVSPAADVAVDGTTLAITVPLVLGPGESTEVVLTVETTRRRESNLDADAGASLVTWADVRVTGADVRLVQAVESSMTDLRALLLTDPDEPSDVFAAAGTPWYLTLFGRDSLWAARLTLPFGTDLARGTLRALARRQGRTSDAASGEAPGKMPHEVRRFPFVDPVTGMSLPSVYYGTVDATALWVVLLHQAWRWGLADDDVRTLLDPLQGAVRWLCGDAVPDGDGLLKYLDTEGHGLSNQGWKDSGDAIRFRDGRVAEPAIALVEAQAYAVQALTCAAALGEAFGTLDPPDLRRRADELSARVRDRFWVTSEVGRYLGMAIDGHGELVDGLGSNMGHVLGTGALSRVDAAGVAATVTGPELLGAFGVRTLGTGNGGFNPIGYHTGSIWTHDTAISALGLSAEGFGAEAARVGRTLLASAEAFDYRWPELYSGEPVMGRPAPYPASCRPQAWSAASAVALVTVALGLEPDPQTRTLHVRPVRPAAYGPMRVEGLLFGGGRVDLDQAADGQVTVLRAPDDVEVRVHDGSAASR